MVPGDLKFSLNQIRIDGVEAFDTSIFDVIQALDTEYLKVAKETLRVEKVEKVLYDERFLSLNFNSGEKYPYTEFVVNVEDSSEIPNPRASDEIELDEQHLVFIDCQEQEIYLSNQKLRKHVEDWLSRKMKRVVNIKIILDEGEFMESVESITSVSMTASSSPTAGGQSMTLAEKLSSDAHGYGAERATLILSYKKNMDVKAREFVSQWMSERKEFKKITVCGRNSDGVESVFDTDKIVYKVAMKTKKDGITGKYNHEDAFKSLMVKIIKSELK